jgi:sporulation protein YlmC with PRC-barrel domain
VNDLSLAYPALADSTAFSGLAIKTANIIGNMVMNRQGEEMGEIDEVVIDVFNGRVAYLVLAFGGFLGMGVKLYAVPWKALYYDNEQQVYVLNMTQDQLAQAPGFEKETWPEFTDEHWNRHVHAYYEQ